MRATTYEIISAINNLPKPTEAGQRISFIIKENTRIGEDIVMKQFNCVSVFSRDLARKYVMPEDCLTWEIQNL